MWTRPPPCPQSHEAEQNQKQRTFDVLPKPDKLIRYRQKMFLNLFQSCLNSLASSMECDIGYAPGCGTSIRPIVEILNGKRGLSLRLARFVGPNLASPAGP